MERFSQTTHLNTAGWVICHVWKELPTDKDSDIFIPNTVQTDRHIRACHQDLRPDESKSQNVPHYTTLTFDIEASTLNVLDPDALSYMVSWILFDSATYAIRPILFTWNPHFAELEKLSAKARVAAMTDPATREKYQKIKIHGVEVFECDSEKQMLQTFADFYRKTDVDNIVGHNVYGYDLNFLIMRAKHHEIEEFEYLGRTGAKNDDPKKNMNRREVAFHKPSRSAAGRHNVLLDGLR